MLRILILMALLLTTNSQALAKTLTAVCGPLNGYTVGMSGSTEKHRVLSYMDSMDGQFTVVWEIGSESALIIGPGSQPSREEGVVAVGTDDQLSLIVTYPVSVFLYSIFPKREMMLVTKHTHTRGLDLDAARGFIMRGDCRISTK